MYNNITLTLCMRFEYMNWRVSSLLWMVLGDSLTEGGMKKIYIRLEDFLKRSEGLNVLSKEIHRLRQLMNRQSSQNVDFHNVNKQILVI